MIIRKIYGLRAKFCGDSCADGFREDRRCGLIYGCFSIDGRIVGWEAASMELNHCAYCRADLDVTAKAIA